MGNSALIIVAAITLSGVLILANTQRISMEADAAQRQMQEDVLARELANTGHGLVLSDMMGGVGNDLRSSVTLAGSPLQYAGGEISVVDYNLNHANKTVDFWVLGEYGGAQHRIHSKYRFQSEFPYLCAADVGNLTLVTSDSSRINGGPDYRPCAVGTSQIQEINNRRGLENMINPDDMERRLNDALETADDGLPGSLTEVEMRRDGNSFEEVLPDLDYFQSQSWLEEFYYKALDRMSFDAQSPDQFYEGAQEFGSNTPDNPSFAQHYTFGSNADPAIIRVQGDMNIRDGSSVTGTGILIVEGSLMVEPNAGLLWDGFVYMRPSESIARADFDGMVNINGSFLAFQEAVPPGGHMDVTTNRDLSGNWAIPRGDDVNQGGIPIAGPWYVHQHKWDTFWFTRGHNRPPISASREVIFLENGTAGPHESSLRFFETINQLASMPQISEVYINLVEPRSSGMAWFTMNTSEMLTPIRGPVPAGFDSNGSMRSPPFAPRELQDLRFQFRSLRMLNLMKDPENVRSGEDGAHRVANDYNRQGSFHLEIRDAASDALLLTTSVYQHVREDELEEDQEELEQLRDDIRNGNFGLTIDMGPNASLVYSNNATTRALARLGAANIRHVASWSQHCSKNDVNCDLTRR